MTFFPLFKVHCKLTVINLVEVDFSLGSIRQRTFFFFFFCGKGGGVKDLHLMKLLVKVKNPIPPCCPTCWLIHYWHMHSLPMFWPTLYHRVTLSHTPTIFYASAIFLYNSMVAKLTTIFVPANLLLQDTIERIHVGGKYGDIPRGIFLVRGENMVLVGEIVSDS